MWIAHASLKCLHLKRTSLPISFLSFLIPSVPLLVLDPYCSTRSISSPVDGGVALRTALSIKQCHIYVQPTLQSPEKMECPGVVESCWPVHSSLYLPIQQIVPLYPLLPSQSAIHAFTNYLFQALCSLRTFFPSAFFP